MGEKFKVRRETFFCYILQNIAINIVQDFQGFKDFQRNDAKVEERIQRMWYFPQFPLLNLTRSPFFLRVVSELKNAPCCITWPTPKSVLKQEIAQEGKKPTELESDLTASVKNKQRGEWVRVLLSY